MNDVVLIEGDSGMFAFKEEKGGCLSAGMVACRSFTSLHLEGKSECSLYSDTEIMGMKKF